MFPCRASIDAVEFTARRRSCSVVVRDESIKVEAVAGPGVLGGDGCGNISSGSHERRDVT